MLLAEFMVRYGLSCWPSSVHQVDYLLNYNADLVQILRVACSNQYTQVTFGFWTNVHASLNSFYETFKLFLTWDLLRL